MKRWDSVDREGQKEKEMNRDIVKVKVTQRDR